MTSIVLTSEQEKDALQENRRKKRIERIVQARELANEQAKQRNQLYKIEQERLKQNLCNKRKKYWKKNQENKIKQLQEELNHAQKSIGCAHKEAQDHSSKMYQKALIDRNKWQHCQRRENMRYRNAAKTKQNLQKKKSENEEFRKSRRQKVKTIENIRSLMASQHQRKQNLQDLESLKKRLEKPSRIPEWRVERHDDDDAKAKVESEENHEEKERKRIDRELAKQKAEERGSQAVKKLKRQRIAAETERNAKMAQMAERRRKQLAVVRSRPVPEPARKRKDNVAKQQKIESSFVNILSKCQKHVKEEEAQTKQYDSIKRGIQTISETKTVHETKPNSHTLQKEVSKLKENKGISPKPRDASAQVQQKPLDRSIQAETPERSMKSPVIPSDDQFSIEGKEFSDWDGFSDDQFDFQTNEVSPDYQKYSRNQQRQQQQQQQEQEENSPWYIPPFPDQAEENSPSSTTQSEMLDSKSSNISTPTKTQYIQDSYSNTWSPSTSLDISSTTWPTTNTTQNYNEEKIPRKDPSSLSTSINTFVPSSSYSSESGTSESSKNTQESPEKDKASESEKSEEISISSETQVDSPTIYDSSSSSSREFSKKTNRQNQQNQQSYFEYSSNLDWTTPSSISFNGFSESDTDTSNKQRQVTVMLESESHSQPTRQTSEPVKSPEYKETQTNYRLFDRNFSSDSESLISFDLSPHESGTSYQGSSTSFSLWNDSQSTTKISNGYSAWDSSNAFWPSSDTPHNQEDTSTPSFWESSKSDDVSSFSLSSRLS